MKQTIKILGEKGIFTEIINRMGVSRMITALAEEQNRIVGELEDLFDEAYKITELRREHTPYFLY